MRDTTIREFARKYDGLLLLSYSDSSIIIGDLYKKKGFFKQHFKFSGYNIAYIAYSSANKCEELKEQLSDINALPGEFAGFRIKDRFSNQDELQLPFINVDISDKIDVEQLLSFEIGSIRKKVLRDENLLAVKEAIRFYNTHENEERGNLDDFWIVNSLFYGADIKITVDKNVQLDIETDFENAINLPSHETDHKNNHVYSFKGCDDYPFAIDLKKISRL